MQDVQIKQGDTMPPMTATLTIGNPAVPIDLTGCTVQLRFGIAQLGVLFLQDAAPQAPFTDGKVRYTWAPGDTDICGTYAAEWVVTLPDLTLLTVPNGFSFALHVLAKVGNLRYDSLAHSGNQTQLLVRRLRARLADTPRLLYTEDSQLAQALLDTFDTFKAEIAGLFHRVEPTEGGYDPDDPLAVAQPATPGFTLTRTQQDIWMLLTAHELLQLEILEAARIAASLRSPAGQQNLTEVYRALRSALQDCELALDRKISEGMALVKFVGLTPGDASRFNDPNAATG